MRKIALIPARSGSLRVKNKNIRELCGHPLMAYAIAGAQQSGCFDQVLVSTDSEQVAGIARHYGAYVPFLRPPELAGPTSPDIEWLKFTLNRLREEGQEFEIFAILRPTSPFRQAATIVRALELLLANPKADSIRAVQKCKEHPGKMWTMNEARDLIEPMLSQTHLDVPWHARQYQDCPEVFVQNSSLEIAHTRVVPQTNSREGAIIAPFLTDRFEGLSIDHEEDWALCELYTRTGQASLPEIRVSPYKG